MVVLAFVPHPVPAIAAHQMHDESRVSFDHALREILVLESHGDRGERGEMRGALGQPEMLKAHPAPIVALAPPGFAAARTAVVGWTPRIEREGGAVLGTETPIRRQNRLVVGNHRHALEQWPRPFPEMRQERLQVRRALHHLSARGEYLGRHHVRTPSADHVKGTTAELATAAAAARASPRMMKNMQPPAPAPAALPPSAPAFAAATSSWAISGVRMPGSSAC